MTYTITMPRTPGAQASAVATATKLADARKQAKSLSSDRRDLRGQDVRIERADGSLVEYAGPAR